MLLLVLFVTRPKSLLFYQFFFPTLLKKKMISSKNLGRDNDGE